MAEYEDCGEAQQGAWGGDTWGDSKPAKGKSSKAAYQSNADLANQQADHFHNIGHTNGEAASRDLANYWQSKADNSD